MGLSTVTISIEEFEDLIENKKKIEEIKKTIKEHCKSLLDINMKLIASTIVGDYEIAKELMEKGDVKNIEALMKINEILESKDESRNKTNGNN